MCSRKKIYRKNVYKENYNSACGLIRIGCINAPHMGFLSQFAQASEFKMKLELARELIEGKWYITAEYDGKKTKFQLVPIDEINELRKSVGLPASQYTYSARNKGQEREEPVSKPDFVESAPAGDSVDLPDDGFSMPPMDDEPYPF